MDNKKIFTYRYMWLLKGSDNTNIRILSGPEAEQKAFIEALLSTGDVFKAVRVYINEVDVTRLDDFENIIKEGDVDETLCNE